MDAFERVLNPYRSNCGWSLKKWRVFVKVKYDGKRLSITGVEGPMISGNAHGGCGQIDLFQSKGAGIPTDEKVALSPDWSWRLVRRLKEIWERWHLNDMRAGSPEQEAVLRPWREALKTQGKSLSYTGRKNYLRIKGLLIDGGYKYGSKWLFEQVPDDILKELQALPETEVEPAWC